MPNFRRLLQRFEDAAVAFAIVSIKNEDKEDIERKAKIYNARKQILLEAIEKESSDAKLFAS